MAVVKTCPGQRSRRIEGARLLGLRWRREQSGQQGASPIRSHLGGGVSVDEVRKWLHVIAYGYVEGA